MNKTPFQALWPTGVKQQWSLGATITLYSGVTELGQGKGQVFKDIFFKNLILSRDSARPEILFANKY